MNISGLVSLFGFISGFLLLITGNTMNFWLSKYGASKEIIGLFSLVSLPYAINFLWAPIFDRVRLDMIPVKINFRLKWIILLHCIGSSLVFLISQFNPITHTLVTAILAVSISFISASQDIVLNAYRTELLPENQQAKSSGMYIFGYRMGMIISGPVAIYLSEYISLNKIYFFFFVIYISFPIILINCCPRDNTQINKKADPIQEFNLLTAFKQIGSAKIIITILLFLILYRVGDNFISVMLNPFLLQIGFDEKEIAIAGRLCGIIGSAFGGLVATQVMNNQNLLKSLFWFGILHSLAHFSYIAVLYSGNDVLALILATTFDSITGGMTMSAYIGFITCLCRGKYRSTQYAIFSAMMGVSRSILPSITGFIVVYTNWVVFFIISVVIIFPALLILKKNEKRISVIINA
jgi:PAT family beta-lactamase induction signal transducer AmpG